MSERPLTPKQTAFVAEYLIDLNATAAATRAGYKDGNKGRQLVTKSNVAAAIAEAQAKRAERTEITQDWTIERLRIEALREGEGASHSARVAALKLLGQHQGMFEGKPPSPAPGSSPEHPMYHVHSISKRLAPYRDAFDAFDAAPDGSGEVRQNGTV